MKQLTAEFVEHIHDVLVGAFLPFDQPISPGEYRDRHLIESALARPFQTAFGREIWPSFDEKAAALFHSLACNHCFLNGNKRTAVIGLDLFLLGNRFFLTMRPGDVYDIATKTADANAQGRGLETVMAELKAQIGAASVPIRVMGDAVKNNDISERDRAIVHRTLDRALILLEQTARSGMPAFIEYTEEGPVDRN